MDQNHNQPDKGNENGGKRPKSNIWMTLIITVAIVLVISAIYNLIAGSQYTLVTYSDFLQAWEDGKLAEVQFQGDRLVYLTKDQAQLPPSAQKACYTGLPTAVFMLKSYFDTIPDEIEEAAMMDGLNRLQIIFRITVPLAMSGLISVFVYCFMVAWNDYLFASIFLSSASNFTLPVGLNALFSTPDYIWGRMMAASLVTALPVVIMYALSERFIKSGLTAGGVKG